jgi:hypothetical protein
MSGNLKVEKTVNGANQGVFVFAGPRQDLVCSVNLPAVSV